MPVTYLITRDLIADGPDSMPRKFRAGETIGKGDMLAGCLESCLAIGYAVIEPPAPEVQPETVGQPEPKPEPKPEPPRRRGR